MTWLKLGIPILLGLAAAGLNWMALNSGTQADEFVRVAEDVRTGGSFSEDNLERIELRGDVGALRRTAVRWNERTRVLVGRPSQRELKKGDLVLWRDVTPPPPELELKEGEAVLPVSLEGVTLPPQLIRVGDHVLFVLAVTPEASPAAKFKPVAPSFEKVGPFRVLSVGDTVYRKAGDQLGGRSTGDVRGITVAMKGGSGKIENPNVLRLLQARWAERAGQRLIVEVALEPSRGQGAK